MRNDDMEYVDASIVRAGEEGSHGDGAYSAGRGGESESPSNSYFICK